MRGQQEKTRTAESPATKETKKMNAAKSRRLLAVLIASLALLAMIPASASAAEFGFKSFDVEFLNEDGTPATQAGSHPYAMTTSFGLNYDPTGIGPIGLPTGLLGGQIKNASFSQVPGLVGAATAVPRCSGVDFNSDPLNCAANTEVGRVEVNLNFTEGFVESPAVYNLEPPPGVAVRVGFRVFAVPTVIDISVSEYPPYNVVAKLVNTSQAQTVFGSKLTLKGIVGGKAFLTLPRSCTGPATSSVEAESWENPGTWVHAASVSHDHAEPPQPQGFTGCGKLGFNPSITAKPTTKAASSPTGLDFSLDVKDEGLANPEGIANADIKKAVVTLPEGFSPNPSIAEGLGVCTRADLARESAFSAPGAGCPNESKIGTIEAETPLLDETLKGSLFLAEPYENKFGSLLALYVVVKDSQRGILIRQPVKVENDPVTGRMTAIAEDLPQFPYTHFRLHFREGARSPLASPPGCSTYGASAVLTPWSGGEPVTATSLFQIVTGPDNGPCPTGGAPPFRPGLGAGTLNNAAGSYSPFNLRLSRSDSEQEITHFSIKLPPGIVGKLAGIPFCSDAAIAAAKARTGPLGGHEELASPSCPAASQIGRTLVGTGVGSSLAYAPGRVYLAGPYNGSQLSLVAITAGVIGPFDIGTVVVREAFKIDPETAEVFIDATGSDPIPHIIKGIPVHLRDIRVYTDRSEFVLNPTSCKRTSTASTVLGSGLDFGSEADDNPITVSTPFQAADCAALPFKPKLSLRLAGGTKRGAHPSFRAHLKMNGIGEAGIAYSQVTLPRSEFLENSHIKTICTRVQFNQGEFPGANCPPGSVYGFAKATTPLLDEPLEGPVFLRSSEHQLPDLVAALHNGKININLVGRIDSVKGGGIRNTFETVPDAPVSSFTLIMQGGKKGLLVNSTNLCKGTHRATVDFTGHNGKVSNTRPALRAKCGGKGGKGKRAQRRNAR